MFAPLYSEKTVKEKFSDIRITSKQRMLANEWLGKLKNKDLEKEKDNYNIFKEVILKELLGYPEKEIKFEDKRVEFSVTDMQGTTHVCFEAKGTKTKDLFERQNYGKTEQEHPVLQTMSNMERFPASYGVCTNYRNFVLLDRNLGITKCHRFDFNDIENNEEKLKEFMGIFSYQKLVLEKTLVTLYKSSVTEEKDFTNEFYKLFHETRLMMIKAFQEKDRVDVDEALHYAQLFLNRLIFIFFAEDKGQIEDRLFTKRVLKILDAVQCTEFSKSICDEIVNLFEVLGKGSDILGIFGFNGGLFEKDIPSKIFFYDLKDADFFKEVKRNSKFGKKIKHDEFSSKVLKKYENKMNPIISNLLLMDSFDFNTEINVNILGHIFEQSINDLNELRRKETSRRKKEGVFYTPEYITDYICTNTIIPYLSDGNSATIDDLILEFSDNIEELQRRIREIKILDPACGSGAFLIKATEILLEIDNEIRRLNPSAMEQRGLAEWSKEQEITKIIENNIFGVDINEESAEITKLSLFLKMASPNRKLSNLSKNIRVGNSLIDDKNVDSKAFDWKSEFKDVLGDGKFDVIIGNPPYIRVQLLDHKHIDWFKKHTVTAYRRIDVSGLFFELAKKLLKNNGVVSFIISNQFIVTDYGRNTRKFLLENFNILNIVDFADLQVFSGASTYVAIFSLQNSSPSNFRYLRMRGEDLGNQISLKESALIKLNGLDETPWKLGTKEQLELLKKISKHKKLCDIGKAGTGLFTGNDDILFFTKIQLDKLNLEKDSLLPVLTGTDPERYSDPKPKNFVIYPYKLENEKTVLLGENDLSKRFPNTYKYLLKNKSELEARKDSRKTFGGKNWYRLVRFGQLSNFSRQKIVTPGEVREQKFAIDNTKCGFLNARIFSVVIDDNNYNLHYVLGLLNSKVIRFFMQFTAPKKQRGYFAYATKFLNDIPLPLADSKLQKEIIDAVCRILKLKQSEKNEKNKVMINDLNNKIDELAFQVFDINDEERIVLEDFIALT